MALIDKFNNCIDFVLQWEGGFVDNPADPGGKTNHGITQTIYNKWLADNKKSKADVKDISLDTVKTIYFDRYFKVIPEVDILSIELLQVLFDTAVNFGLSGMVIFLQEALSVEMTGFYGDTTREKFLKNNSKDFALKIVENRKKYRYTRCLENPSQNVFLQGWLNRDEALRQKTYNGKEVEPMADDKVIMYPLKSLDCKGLYIDLQQNPPKIFPFSGEEGKKILILDLRKLGQEKARWINENPLEGKQEPVKSEVKTDTKKDVLEICEEERKAGGQDFKEVNGSNSGPQVKKYLEYVGLTEGNPWCAAFACWVLGQAGIGNPKTGDTWAIEEWARQKGIYSQTPAAKDVFLLIDSATGKPLHTGFIVKVNPDGQTITTIEGNLDDGIRYKYDRSISSCKYIRWYNQKSENII